MINRMLNRISPFRSVRARFSAVMGGSGIVLGFALTLFMEWKLEEGLHASVRDALNAVADEIAHELTADLTNRQREMVLMAHMIGTNTIVRMDSVQDVMDGLKSRQNAYAWIGMADVQGTVQSASAGLLTGQDVSSRPWFKAGLEGNFVGDPHDAVMLARFLAARPDGEPLRFLDVAAPVKDSQGNVRGVLAGHLYWDWVHKVVSSSVTKRRTKKDIEVLIADGEGEWLLSYNTDRNRQPANLRSAGADQAFLVTTQEVVIGSAARGPGWTVVVREDAHRAYAPIREARTLMLIFTAMFAGAFAWASWLIAGRMVRPIVQLADAAKGHTVEAPRQPGQPTPRAQYETSVLGEAMDRLVHHDRLTGLYNRAEVLQRLQGVIECAATQHVHGVLLLINLDNFSILNNVRGHHVGDQLLIAVAQRLRRIESSGALLARPGGDEFLVLMENQGADRAEVLQRADSFAQLALAEFQEPFVLDDGDYHCNVSIGVALVGDDSLTVDDVLKHAELAVLEAKKRGKGQAVMFDQRMQDALYERVQFEAALKAAIPNQLVAFFQPQMDQVAGLTGAEVLVRWRHPTQGMVSPAQFIPLAEQTGLIVPIGLWVVETACRQLRAWEGQPGKGHLVLAVNVSAKEFSRPDYVHGVQRILFSTGANPQRLKLELTESVLAHDVDEVVSRMQALKAMGISFALDDFGTGFSSLSYLKRMPLDQLKIDQSFVRDVTVNASDASIVRAVIALSQGLSLQVIAEGVETEEQRELLHRYGCASYQGYLFGRPVPIEEFEQHLPPPVAVEPLQPAGPASR